MSLNICDTNVLLSHELRALHRATVFTTTEERPPLVPLLRWLRTTIVLEVGSEDDCATTPLQEERVPFRLLSQTMVEHVVLKGQTNSDVLDTLLALPCLMSLDLRDVRAVGVYDGFLRPIAQRHPRLRRLYLPRYAHVSQSCLEGFRHLEELDINCCRNMNSVHFCAGTLRVLDATHTSIDDEGLANAVHLEVLHVHNCRGVTSVAPFAATLRSLNAGGPSCGIDDAALVHATSLETLDVSNNDNITTLQPFAHSLKELIAQWLCGLDSAALAQATNLVKLDVSNNVRISFVPPTVRELIAKGVCSSITDRSLLDASQIVYLNVNGNPNVTSEKPICRDPPLT